MPGIKAAARRWVLANYEFRYGVNCFEDGPSKEIIEAEKALLLAVAGSDDPVTAAEALGAHPDLDRALRAKRFKKAADTFSSKAAKRAEKATAAKEAHRPRLRLPKPTAAPKKASKKKRKGRGSKGFFS